MDILSLSKTNRLFWLGRYSERVQTTIIYLMDRLDRMVDGAPLDYTDFCGRLGIPADYPDAMTFMRRYLFEAGPFSLRSAADEMLGNGMVLRETIGSETLAYLQMAAMTLDEGTGSDAPGLTLQAVVDDIMAFRGSYLDAIDDEATRMVIRVGGIVERLSLYGRLDMNRSCWQQELNKLSNRLSRSVLRTNARAYAVLEGFRYEEDPAAIDALEMARAAESLIIL